MITWASHVRGIATLESFLQTTNVWSHILDKLSPVEDDTVKKLVETVLMSVVSKVIKIFKDLITVYIGYAWITLNDF